MGEKKEKEVVNETVNRKYFKTLKGIGKNKSGSISFFFNPITKTLNVSSKNVLTFSAETVKKITRYIPDVAEIATGIKIDGDFETIGEKTFSSGFAFKKIEIETIRKIENEAFKDVSNLKEVKFGNKLYEIGDSAFDGCISLRKVVVPGWRSISISNSAFPYWVNVKVK